MPEEDNSDKDDEDNEERGSNMCGDDSTSSSGDKDNLPMKPPTELPFPKTHQDDNEYKGKEGTIDVEGPFPCKVDACGKECKPTEHLQ